MSEYDFGVFIGRFQPLHVGHEHAIRAALKRVGRLIVLIGSANVARNPRNPFTYDERYAMLRTTFAYEMAEGRVIVEPLDDHPYSDADWTVEVERRVARIVAAAPRADRAATVALTGCAKDATGYYLELFPRYANLRFERPYATFSATDIRHAYFRRIPQVPTSIVSPGVAAWLDMFAHGDAFRALLDETLYLDDYARTWGSGPFVTADAVVVHDDALLVIERGRLPGRGQLALPGGFVGGDERIRDAAIRELREETMIADDAGPMTHAALAGTIDDGRTRVFDAPTRSLRGRIVSHAFLFRVEGERPRVAGGDDAAEAHWVALDSLSPAMFFEDHWSIVTVMTKR